jgi:hypothetical protein
MKGMFGFIIRDNTLINSVNILQEVKPGEKYLVQFLNDPTFSRVVDVEEVQSWLLFQNQQIAANWMAKNQPPAPPADEPPPPPPGDEPPGDEPPPPPADDETPPPIEDQLEETASGGNGADDDADQLCIHGVNLYKEYCDQGQCHAWTKKHMPHLLPENQTAEPEPQTQGEKDDTSDVS